MLFMKKFKDASEHRRKTVKSIREIENILKNREPGTIGKHKFFSVAIPLVETEEGLSLLFEVRASRLKTQPGDICFPGGNIEEGESPAECALREMEEEIGISASEVNVIGQFDTLYGFSGYTLYTFVTELDRKLLEKIRINEDEVAEVFTVPVEFFAKNPPENYDVEVVSKVEDFPYDKTGISPDYNWRKGVNILPLYRYKDKIIWGITARMTKWLVEKIVI